jgi:putative transcriptional regulator
MAMHEQRLRNTIKLQRSKLALTQEQLADRVKVSRKTVNTIENGKFIPSTVLALQLSHALGVTVEELFTLENSRV